MQPTSTTYQPLSTEPYGGVPSAVRRRDHPHPAVAAAAADAATGGGSATGHTVPNPYLAVPGYPHPHGSVEDAITTTAAAATSTAAGGRDGATRTRQRRNGGGAARARRKKYEHNVATAGLILPPLLSLIMMQPTPYPLMVLLFCTLLLYGLDLTNSRDGVALGIWISFAVTSISLLSGAWDDSGGLMGGGTWVFVTMRTAASVMLLFSLASWATLQMRWLHYDTPAFTIALERMLHAILPLASAAVMTFCATSIVAVNFGLEEMGATLFPLLFAVLLSLGIAIHGSATSSFESALTEDNTNGKDSSPKASDIPRAIASSDGSLFSFVLVGLPPLSHLATFRHRILHAYASWDDWFELALVLAVPYMLHYFLLLLDKIWWKQSLPAFLRAGTADTLRGAFLPVLFSLVSSVAFQQRYMVPVCASISFLFNGHEVQSSAVTSMYLTISACSSVVALWFYRRKNQSDELLCGDYHEDVFQLILATSGACFALGFGLPLKFVPLPTLMLLGFAIYLSTRMLRFYAVIIFTLLLSLSFLIQYRFIYIPTTVHLLPTFEVSLAWFAWMISCVGFLVLTIVGLVLRSPDGIGAVFLRKIDLTGMLLCSYAALLGIAEAILLKEPIMVTGREADNYYEVDTVRIYDPYLAVVTGILLLCIASRLLKTRCIKTGTAAITASICVGKIIVVISDAAGPDGSLNTTWTLMRNEVIASLLLVVVFAPYVILEPIHTKYRSKRSLGPSGKPITSLSSLARKTVTIYCGVTLPAVIIVSVPTVIKPFFDFIRDTGAYYNTPPSISEIFGAVLSLWGLAALSMLNYFLPDGGADAWRKSAALAFLMGLGVMVAAPTVPGMNDVAVSSRAFASVSSLGAGMTSDKSGGWGIVAASLAILLALTGPLELRERRDSSGSRDNLLFFRVMVFSILFGCGVAWFVVLQSMSDEPFVSLFLTATSCLIMAFFGTIASVLGYFLELEEFGEAQQIAKLWVVAFPMFLVLSGVSVLSVDASPPFGPGGCLSTYLAVCGSCNFAFAAALKARKNKSQATRGLGNGSCFASWALTISVVYGLFGLASIGVPSGILFGCPLSVVGTIFASFLLLLLDGEASERSTRSYSLASQRKQVSSFGVNLPNLTKANRFAPPVAGMVVVLLTSSLYAIFVRGCWILPSLSWLGGKVEGIVHKNHEDVFASIFGSASRSTGVMADEDVASMAQKSLVHSASIASAAKLAGSGFWTSNNIFGPLLHLGGTLAVIPSLFCLLSFMWAGTKYPPGKVMALLPLNSVAWILCKGIPSLWALAIISIVGGSVQVIFARRSQHAAHMRI